MAVQQAFDDFMTLLGTQLLPTACNIAPTSQVGNNLTIKDVKQLKPEK